MSRTPPPADLPRRSFVYRKLLSRGARASDIDGGLAVLQFCPRWRPLAGRFGPCRLGAVRASRAMYRQASDGGGDDRTRHNEMAGREARPLR